MLVAAVAVVAVNVAVAVFVAVDYVGPVKIYFFILKFRGHCNYDEYKFNYEYQKSVFEILFRKEALPVAGIVVVSIAVVGVDVAVVVVGVVVVVVVAAVVIAVAASVVVAAADGAVVVSVLMLRQN